MVQRLSGSAGWRTFIKPWSVRISLIVIALLTLTALFADMIASDFPLIARYNGRLYIFPNLFAQKVFTTGTCPELKKRINPGDWMICSPLPFGPDHHDMTAIRQSPGFVHILGTDDRGRDILSRIVHGTRVSLTVGLLAVMIYMLIGTILGLTAGYYGGLWDMIISRLIEIMLSFPTVFLIFGIIGLLTNPSVLLIMIVIGLTSWAYVAQLVRGEALRLREEAFVYAARALGAGDLRIILRCILPGLTGQLMVTATFGISNAILIEGFLGFLGFGGEGVSWGQIFAQSDFGSMRDWWVAIPAGLALFLTVLAYNMLGEAIREALDPKLSR